MSSNALDAFMQLKSIDPNFIDALGELTTATNENIQGIVKEMGFDTDDDNALALHYQEEETRHWLSLLAPVAVFQQSTSYELEVHLPIDFVTDELLYRVTTEDGLQIDKLLTATDFPLLAVNEISEVEFQLYSVTLPIKLDLGYHHLALLEVGNEEPLAVMQVIVTPNICYQSKLIQKENKIVSANLSLPVFHSIESVKPAITEVIKNGIDLVCLTFNKQLKDLPEQWANVLQLDLSAVAEFNECKIAQDKLKELSGLIENNDRIENSNIIEVVKLKLAVLRHLFDEFNRMKKEKNKSWDIFSTFMKKGGEALKQQVSFYGLHYKFLSEQGAFDYSTWPLSFQSYASQGTQDWIAGNGNELLFWYYCSWLIEKQLTELDKFIHTQEGTLGFYKQMTIGAARYSGKIWAQNDCYCKNIIIETPLDYPTTLNENIAHLPLIPDKLYKSAYQSFIELLQSNMKHTDVLHIQHIISLLRLWWVPEHSHKEQGVFVYYNVYDMLNLLALESMRNKCAVVSDDLENLPDGMEILLQEAGVYSLSLFDFK